MTVKVNGKEVEWVDTPKGKYREGVKMHVLWQDEKTGASLLLIKSPKGRAPEKPEHHPETNQLTIMLSGEGELPDGTRIKASADDIRFDFVPKGKVHGETAFEIIREIIWVRYYDGPFTWVND